MIWTENQLQEKVISQTHPLTQKILFSLILLFIVSISFLVNNQFIVGSLVNAGLLLTCMYFGMPAALFIGIIPSCMALIRGILPSFMLPAIPFIIVSNWIFVSSYSYLQRRKIAGIIFASLLKFLFLFCVSRFIISQFIPAPALSVFLIMMSWPQLVTALTGGFIAYGIANIRK